MRKSPSIVIGFLIAVAIAATPAAASKPTLYSLLRTADYPDVSLPAAFSSANLAAKAAPSKARSAGAIGEVDVELVGPDPVDGITFVVFKTADGAHASLSSVTPTTPDLHLAPSGKVPGFAVSGMWTGWVPDVDVISQETRRTVTFAVVQQGNVLVVGFTHSHYVNKGNVSGAIALAKSGARHVRALALNV